MAKSKNALAVASKAIDPTLDALFASSAGPVTVPSQTRLGAPQVKKSSSAAKSNEEDGDDQGDDEVLSEISEELDYGDDDEEEAGDDSAENEDDQDGNDEEAMSVTMEAAEAEEKINGLEEAKPKRERKRKRKQDNDDLEGKYLAKLADDEAEPSGKRLKGGEEDAQDGAKEDDEDEVPVHESLTQESKQSEVEKAARTVFLGNVATEAISSKSAKKELMKHLSSVLDKDASPPQKVESLRFRSVAFSTGSMPKRAAYITKALMDATTKSTNAYAVFSTPAAARKVVAELNGTEILGRHIRVDSVAHPSPMNHRNCVFVGNLGFVDDETVLNQKADGETVEKKRNKVPSDIEEGLWRTFGTQGKVENVRVVRDSKTRVGKGFAYVQFYDANDVEAALLLNGKKFPPMLPRLLRVTRAKDPRKTAQAVERARSKADVADGTSRSTKYKPKATPEEQAAAGRTRKLLGRSAAAKQRRPGRRSFASAAKDGEAAEGGIQTPEAIIFEGRRASSKDGLPKDLKMGKKNKKKAGRPMRPQNRGAKRAAAWKKK
ncbi:Nucleolar protein 12 [Trichoderma simmonsii]|uniref:Nucleolar protein 12 n=2 Tax=Trichoderma simmonsii TaxID=1491479 RepID=A0A8G0LF74_9HYPO|nr:Nucleolar protein 12 [Trichoderma simmonsii]